MLSALAVVALGVATSSSSFAATKVGGFTPGETVTISFDGFCDGMAITLTSTTLVGGSLTGCSAGTGIAAGNIVIDSEVTPFTGMPGVGINMVSTAAGTSYVLVYLFDPANGTWANYFSYEDELPTLGYSGTYSIVGVTPTKVGPTSTAVRPKN